MSVASGGRAPEDKSVGVAFALTFFLGPIGVFYVSVWGAIILIVVAFLGVATFGATTLLSWVISIVYGCVRASQRHSEFQLRLANPGVPYAQPSHQAPPPSFGGPGTQAGWFVDPAGSGRLRWWDGSRWTDEWAGPPPGR